MIFAFVLLAMGVASVWLAALQLLDYRKRRGDFSDWIVSDAAPLNRKLWRANIWVMTSALFVGGAVCVAAFLSLMLAK